MKRNASSHTVLVPVGSGFCRWCGCTYERPCANGCSWIDRAQTLCSECAPLDRALRSRKGRRELAEFLQEHSFQ